MESICWFLSTSAILVGFERWSRSHAGTSSGATFTSACIGQRSRNSPSSAGGKSKLLISTNFSAGIVGSDAGRGGGSAIGVVVEGWEIFAIGWP